MAGNLTPQIRNNMLKVKDVKASDVVYCSPSSKREITAEQTTCWKCKDKLKCDLAYDAYNIDGDCLMIK